MHKYRVTFYNLSDQVSGKSPNDAIQFFSWQYSLNNITIKNSGDHIWRIYDNGCEAGYIWRI